MAVLGKTSGGGYFNACIDNFPWWSLGESWRLLAYFAVHLPNYWRMVALSKCVHHESKLKWSRGTMLVSHHFFNYWRLKRTASMSKYLLGFNSVLKNPIMFSYLIFRRASWLVTSILFAARSSYMTIMVALRQAVQYFYSPRNLQSIDFRSHLVLVRSQPGSVHWKSK